MRAASSVVAIACALAGTARADSKAAADAFDRGRALMKVQHYAEACAAFEQSYQLDPAQGTLFNLADCDAQLGKLATAWNHYRELARSDSNADRRAMSERLAKQLAPRVPKLIVTIAKQPDGAVLVVDGHDTTALAGVELPVDLGKHAIEVTAPGFRAWKQDIAADREAVVSNVVVTLELEGSTTAAAAPQPGELRAEAEPDSRATWVKIAMLSGGALVAGGLVTGALAYSQWQHAKSCTGCVRSSESHSAELRGNIATVLVAIGLADAGAGFYLWKTSRGSAQVTAAIAPGGGAVVIGGRF
ncbi:MAG TPA: tetratricopeptide repeat protein [Kofleriaceae bacterium]